MSAGPPYDIFPFPPLKYPWSSDTLIELLAEGYELTACCEVYGCGHQARVNLIALTRRLGPNHSSAAEEIAARFFCASCEQAGRKRGKLRFIVHVPLVTSAWPRRAKG